MVSRPDLKIRGPRAKIFWGPKWSITKIAYLPKLMPCVKYIYSYN
jgi:hypothetical protein